MKNLNFTLKDLAILVTLFTLMCMFFNSCATSTYHTPCAAYTEQTNANPEVSVTAIGEDSVCVSFTFYY